MYQWPPHSGHTNDLLLIEPVLDENGDGVVMKIEPGESLALHSILLIGVIFLKIGT